MFPLALHEIARVDAIDVGQLDQDLDRDRPLVALHQVQIARRDIELGGHGGLRQVTLPAQPLEAGASEDFAGNRGHGGGFRSDENYLHRYNLTMYICYIATSIRPYGTNMGLDPCGVLRYFTMQLEDFRPFVNLCECCDWREK